MITVAVPTVDRPTMLARALRSVLLQAGDDLQVIVSDNASEADLRLLVPQLADPRVTFQRHADRLTMTENWNSCLSAAKGDFFLLLSDDDQLEPDGLAPLRRCFHRADGSDDPRIGVAYGRALVVGSDGASLWKSARGAADENAPAFFDGLLNHRRAIYPCGTMLRTAALSSVGGYDGRRFGPAADVGAALQVALACGQVRFTDAMVCRYTEHQANLTGQLDFAQWTRAIRELGALVLERPGVVAADGAALERALRRFVAYFVMDVSGKRSLADGSGAITAWRRAERARAAAGCPPAPAASARIFAKLLFLNSRHLASRCGAIWRRKGACGH